MKCKLNNREVEVESMEPGDGSMMITEAYYTDDDTDLTEDEMLQLESNYSDELESAYFEHQVCYAEYAFEGDR